MAKSRRSTLPRALVAGAACLCAAAGTPVASADSGNPAVTCDQSLLDGVEQDVCVGNPGAAAGVTVPHDYPWVVPRLEFGVGIGG
ncbi:hypothetical protein ABIA30_005457 [Mycobacterium sp. MAA66]